MTIMTVRCGCVLPSRAATPRARALAARASTAPPSRTSWTGVCVCGVALLRARLWLQVCVSTLTQRPEAPACLAARLCLPPPLVRGTRCRCQPARARAHTHTSLRPSATTAQPAAAQRARRAVHGQQRAEHQRQVRPALARLQCVAAGAAANGPLQALWFASCLFVRARAHVRPAPVLRSLGLNHITGARSPTHTHTRARAHTHTHTHTQHLP
jgi:hypothetical protein